MNTSMQPLPRSRALPTPQKPISCSFPVNIPPPKLTIILTRHYSLALLVIFCYMESYSIMFAHVAFVYSFCIVSIIQIHPNLSILLSIDILSFSSLELLSINCYELSCTNLLGHIYAYVLNMYLSGIAGSIKVCLPSLYN